MDTYFKSFREKSYQIEVSRNEPFSGHFFSFFNTRKNSNLSIRFPVVIPTSGKNICKEGKELAKYKPDFREEQPKKFNEQQIYLAMNLLKNYSYKEVEKMTSISKSTLTRNKRKQVVMVQ